MDLSHPTLSPTTEAELVQRAIDGDREAFARLYDEHVDRIYRYLLSRLGTPEAAEDVTSEVFLKAWEQLPRHRLGSRPFAAWLFRVAHNAIIDEIRRARRVNDRELSGPLPAANPGGPEVGAEQRLRAARVRQALKDLTEDQRQVLALRFFGGLTTREIAREMGKREGAVRALQMRGLQALAARLGDGDV
ncbi:MAG: sigma-70 family RNA polymerase sigma factor [Chloroflexota bacterium]